MVHSFKGRYSFLLILTDLKILIDKILQSFKDTNNNKLEESKNQIESL